MTKLVDIEALRTYNNNVDSRLVKLENATTADNASNLGGYPSTAYVRSINDISPDENGNIKVTTSEVDLTGIVKSVNSIKPDIDGNVNITGVSDSNAEVISQYNSNLETVKQELSNDLNTLSSQAVKSVMEFMLIPMAIQMLSKAGAVIYVLRKVLNCVLVV